MFLSRETQSGNQKTKSQMFVTMGDGGNKSTEKIWEENGFFNDQKIDLTIPKVNFPENTLCYVNQGTVSQIKDGNAIYLEYVILSQIMAMANIDPQTLIWILMSLRKMSAFSLFLVIIKKMVCFKVLKEQLVL